MAVSKNFSLGVILASATLTIMAGSIIAPVLNLMRDGLGVAPASVGLIITTHGLFMALFSPLMGSVIDRKGARGPYIAALICYGLAGGSGLLINSFSSALIPDLVRSSGSQMRRTCSGVNSKRTSRSSNSSRAGLRPKACHRRRAWTNPSAWRGEGSALSSRMART